MTRQPFVSSLIHLILVAITLAIDVNAQEPNESQRVADRASATANTNEYINTIRPHLFGNLSSSESAIYQKISFRVTNLEATWKAASGMEDGERVVEIDEGVARQMEILTAALIIEKIQGREVLIPYIRYAALSMNRNATFIKDVTTFAHFDPDRIDTNTTLHREQIAMVLNGMAFLLAHEVGHHMLGHYDRPRPSDPSSLRQLELDADAWAIKRCLGAHPHFSPMGGLLPLLFAYYTTPHPITREDSSDHPAEVRRIRKLFEAMQSSLPDFRDEIIKSGASYQDFRDYVSRMVVDYGREIEKNDTPVEELSSIGTSSQSQDLGSEKDEAARTRRRARARVGGFCGDVQGRRYCQMVTPMPIGSACTCSNIAGWGVVVP